MTEGRAGSCQVTAIPLRFSQADQSAGEIERRGLRMPTVEMDGLLKELFAFRRVSAVDETRQISERGAYREGIRAIQLFLQFERFSMVRLRRRQIAQSGVERRPIIQEHRIDGVLFAELLTK